MTIAPDSLKEWAAALTTAGGVALTGWRYGQRISGWCRLRWRARRIAAATRAKAQADAEKAIRVRDETINLLTIQRDELERRYTELRADKTQADAEIDRLWARTRHLETLLDRTRR